MKLEQTMLNELLQTTARSAQTYVPAVVDGTSRFAVFGAPGVQPDFSLQNTKMPPKELLFPPTEKLYRWGSQGGQAYIEPLVPTVEPFVIFGVRPCDVAAIGRLDEVFLTRGYVDEFYQARREAATIVALACNRAADSCFCQSLGSDPNEAPGADVLLLEGEGGFDVRAQTDKGASLVDLWKPLLSDGDVARERTECRLNVNTDGLADKLHGLFNDPVWDEVSTACLTCGSCTFICPTCHCFDISQERDEAGQSTRIRCWDSCMFKDYTLMAGNHNPRDDKRSRVRQRFMHKLCFFEERYGDPLCVGCGRCLVDCPAGMDITSIIDRVNAMPAPDASPEVGEDARGEAAASLIETVAAERKE